MYFCNVFYSIIVITSLPFGACVLVIEQIRNNAQHHGDVALVVMTVSCIPSEFTGRKNKNGSMAMQGQDIGFSLFLKLLIIQVLSKVRLACVLIVNNYLVPGYFKFPFLSYGKGKQQRILLFIFIFLIHLLLDSNSNLRSVRLLTHTIRFEKLSNSKQTQICYHLFIIISQIQLNMISEIILY